MKGEGLNRRRFLGGLGIVAASGLPLPPEAQAKAFPSLEGGQKIIHSIVRDRMDYEKAEKFLKTMKDFLEKLDAAWAGVEKKPTQTESELSEVFEDVFEGYFESYALATGMHPLQRNDLTDSEAITRALLLTRYVPVREKIYGHLVQVYELIQEKIKRDYKKETPSGIPSPDQATVSGEDA